jgi:riboflavin kinase/FMN adenylyltransferase
MKTPIKHKAIEIRGKVIHGLGFGKVLGFPTANLERRSYSRRRINIKLGIWAGWAELPSGKKYPSAIVVGPLDKTDLPKIEVHLINFKGNLYGKHLTIYLDIHIRPFKKFKSEILLKRQIKKDIFKIQSILK